MYVQNNVYKSAILPSLLYASQVWFPRAQCHRESIEKVQRFMCRIITNNYELSYERLLENVATFTPLWQKVMCDRMCLFYQ